MAGFGDVSIGAASGIGVLAVGGAPAPGSFQPGGPGVHAIGAGGAPFTPLNFEDFGFGELTNGRAQIELEPDFAATVNTDAYHAFITEYGDNSALYVTNPTNTGFEVRAKKTRGKISTRKAKFSYRVVAKRKDITPARLEKVTLPTETLSNIKRRSSHEYTENAGASGDTYPYSNRFFACLLPNRHESGRWRLFGDDYR